ncbi:PepSY-like domain-containing protein [Flavobacterium rhizosphaerae]|uniref:PepSY-like domain-containing protein n=1 Tax=Flavobacterium rhizosphaerae TaxID=3163298 RepID=A0ABW8YU11_9FLAO
MKKIVFAITVLSFISCNAQKRNIGLTELPGQAQSFVTTYYPSQAISYIIEEKDTHSTEYEIHFSGSAEVEFDAAGLWKEVEANASVIPPGLLPKKISAYLAKNYKGQNIEKIERKNWGYKVECFSDLELEFDKNGDFLRIDS